MDTDKTPPEELETTATAGPEGGAARRIGHYRILERIGEGGMGEVWLAEQTEPVRRKVALKVIKRGMDTGRVVARFEAERQALALMDHPAIATVHDAGATADGRPYFVMEYVRGAPLTEYCDRNGLTTRERLALFVHVCEGVQHAHHKAVIHRDLKPSNVLVAEVEGRPFPKIIDFGVAKALGQPLTDKTIHTEFGAMVGTLEYMSPEQADVKIDDIDTRSDVYSLGVLLYELLVGALPFDPRVLRAAGFEAVRRKIREEEPPRPSLRLSTLDEESSEASARRRGVDPPTLRRQLSGDLDWITMKALEKERSRRYGSPREFAADIERHLADRPVVARSPQVRYRIAKFARRHRIGVGVVAAGLLVLLTFVGAMTWQARRLATERKRTQRQAESVAQWLGRLDPADDGSGLIDFGVDLDRFAPLGTGRENAARWFAAFYRPGGPRLGEFEAARRHAVESAEAGGGRVKSIPWHRSSMLLPDDPLLLEAEHWVDQAVMRFYPDVWEPDGFRTTFPNLQMIRGLASSWIARGDANADVAEALNDYRRAIRLGRLLRQDDFSLLMDLNGLACIRDGLEAMGRRLRETGDERDIEGIALMLSDITRQRFSSSLLYLTIDVTPYAHTSWFAVRLDVPEWKLSQLGTVAVSNPNRRFRREAAAFLCEIRWAGRGKQRQRAREFLDQVAASGDPLLASDAACPVNPYRAGLAGVDR